MTRLQRKEELIKLNKMLEARLSTLTTNIDSMENELASLRAQLKK